MTGIFPTTGVAASQTQNALSDPPLADGVEALWYANRCKVQVDPFSQNAIISELLNVMKAAGIEYDPDKTTNLSEVIAALISASCEGTATDAATIAAILSDITTLKSTTATLTSCCNTVQAQITALQLASQAGTTLQTQVSSLATRVTANESAIAGLEAAVTALETQATTAGAAIPALQACCTAVQSDLTTLTNDLNAVQTAVTALQARDAIVKDQIHNAAVAAGVTPIDDTDTDLLVKTLAAYQALVGASTYDFATI